MKKKLKWLRCFKDDYSASDSFLELMDEQLKTKFETKYRADCPFTAIIGHPLYYELPCWAECQIVPMLGGVYLLVRVY